MMSKRKPLTVASSIAALPIPDGYVRISNGKTMHIRYNNEWHLLTQSISNTNILEAPNVPCRARLFYMEFSE